MLTSPADADATGSNENGHEAPTRFWDEFVASGALLSTVVYLGTVSLLVLAIVSMTGGHFVYTLDDPYIHLALAERIRAGLYGINASEFASPSSSIVWPLLFVPFARSAQIAYLPLYLNICLGVGTVWLLTLCVRKSFGLHGTETNARARLLMLLLVFALNLPGLALTGLEHVLEVMLSVCCAYAVLCLLNRSEVPTWTLIAAVALPSVRYEGTLITMAVTIALWGSGRRRTAAMLVGCSAVVPVCFSLYLRHLGLPLFPLSVLLKSSANLLAGNSLSSRVIGTSLHLAIDTLRSPERAPELILCAVLGYLAWRNRQQRNTFFCAMAGLVAALAQTVVGPNGWFFRYEIYALVFTLLIAIAVDQRTSSARTGNALVPGLPWGRPSGGVLVAVAALAVVYMQPLLASPAAALGIYEQQFQLARLMSDFYTGPVAVNDLGLVSFHRQPAQYIFDVYGLGSYESARVRPADKTPMWLEAITREHHIGLVAVYPEWFEHGVPASWIALGKMCSPHAPVSSYSSRVMLYATSDGSAQEAEQAIQRFAQTLPRETTLELHPADSYNTCPKA